MWLSVGHLQGMGSLGGARIPWKIQEPQNYPIVTIIYLLVSKYTAKQLINIIVFFRWSDPYFIDEETGLEKN